MNSSASLRCTLIAAILLVSAGSQIAQSQIPDSLKKSLTIETVPPGANVFIGDSLSGTTPFFSSEIPYGVHTIRVSRPGYSDESDTVRVSFGDHHNRSYRLLLPGGIAIRSQPSGAHVFLGDTLLGITPLEIGGLRPGRHKVRISTPEYHDWNQTVVVPESSTAKIQVNMVSAYGTLSILVDPNDTQILVDGEEAGAGTLSMHKLLVGRRSIEIRHAEARRTASVSVFVGPGAEFYLKGEIRKPYLTPFLISLFLPGVGQIYDGEAAEGLGIAAAMLATGGFLGYAILDYNNRLSEYTDARLKYLNETQDEVRLIQFRNEMLAKYEKANSGYTRQKIAVALVGIVYVYNVVDALLWHREKYRITVIDRPSFEQGVGLVPGSGVSLSLRLSLE